MKSRMGRIITGALSVVAWHLQNQFALLENKAHAQDGVEQTDSLCHHHVEHSYGLFAVPRWC